MSLGRVFPVTISNTGFAIVIAMIMISWIIVMTVSVVAGISVMIARVKG